MASSSNSEKPGLLVLAQKGAGILCGIGATVAIGTAAFDGLTHVRLTYTVRNTVGPTHPTNVAYRNNCRYPKMLAHAIDVSRDTIEIANTYNSRGIETRYAVAEIDRTVGSRSYLYDLDTLKIHKFKAEQSLKAANDPNLTLTGKINRIVKIHNGQLSFPDFPACNYQPLKYQPAKTVKIQPIKPFDPIKTILYRAAAGTFLTGATVYVGSTGLFIAGSLAGAGFSAIGSGLNNRKRRIEENQDRETLNTLTNEIRTRLYGDNPGEIDITRVGLCISQLYAQQFNDEESRILTEQLKSLFCLPTSEHLDRLIIARGFERRLAVNFSDYNSLTSVDENESPILKIAQKALACYVLLSQDPKIADFLKKEIGRERSEYGGLFQQCLTDPSVDQWFRNINNEKVGQIIEALSQNNTLEQEHVSFLVKESIVMASPLPVALETRHASEIGRAR
jgi:hypothetical protein